LFASSLSETNAEHSQQVSISSLGLNESFNQSVPFLHKLTELVSGDAHPIEVGIAVESFDFFNLYLHLSPVFIVALVL
jgi:hypothetical protein